MGLLFQGNPTLRGFVRDSSWVRKSFMLDGKTLDNNIKRWRTYSNVFSKFTNTSLGGNFSINNLPMYTQYADIMSPGVSLNSAKHKTAGEANSTGMGRYYSEAIDDQAQLLHLRFGTPRYTGIVSFFTSFYSHEAAMLAREGRVSFSYYIGKAATTIVTLPIQLTVMVISGIGQAINFLTGVPSSKYYYMVPAMGPYWNRVNLIVNNIAVTMGIVPMVFKNSAGAEAQKQFPVGQTESQETDEYRNFAARAYPGIFNESGQVDIYKVANRAKRLQNTRYSQLEEIGLKANSPAELSKKLADFVTNTKITDPGGQDIRDYLKHFHEGPLGSIDEAQADNLSDKINSMDMSELSSTDQATDSTATEAGTTTEEGASAGEGESSAGTTAKPARSVADMENLKKSDLLTKRMPADDSGNENLVVGKLSTLSIVEKFKADMAEGSQFVTFKVDYQGAAGESFSNSFGEAQIASTLNGLSNAAKQARFTFSDGNVGSDIIDGVVKSVKDFAAGTLDGIYLGGLLALAGNALVDVPKVWESSSTQFPAMQYTMELRTWCGNKFGQFMNLVVPLAMLLAGALPISTGPQSYTQPFLCEAYCKGRGQTRLGMIESLSVTRYAGNMGSNNEHQALGYDITFSIADLNTLLHMPIDAGFSLREPYKLIFDNDNAFKDYCSVLGSSSLADQIYVARKLMIRMSQAKMAVGSYWSWSRVSNNFSNIATVQAVAGMFTGDSARAYL